MPLQSIRNTDAATLARLKNGFLNIYVLLQELRFVKIACIDPNVAIFRLSQKLAIE
jgi:hypothetical protein